MQGPIPIESRALGTLAYIRTSIESSGSMAVPGMAGIVMGAIGILAAIVTSLPRFAPFWPPSVDIGNAWPNNQDYPGGREPLSSKGRGIVGCVLART